MKIRPITVLSIAFAALAGAQGVARAAQDAAPPATAQQLFEAGQYDQALAALQQDGDAQMTMQDHYLASMILLRQTPPETDRAIAELDALRASDREAWRQAAASAQALARDNTAEALTAATAAVAADANLFAAQYQLGLARAKTQDWAGAAEAFERATALDPAFAYAHYYAGIAYSRLRRPDREVQHFDTFVKLAPKAPERLAVESILKTLRGR